ncbi:MAG: uncharacterized protein QOF48_848 [Verrucomicrobiota bacterium]|jgi:uncharacterized membrane protein YqgA involved in biofilm formation
MLLLGTLLNVVGILAGGILGLTRRRQPGLPTQVALKNILGVLTVFIGLATTWSGLSTGGVGRFFQVLIIAIVAMMLGRLTGRLMHLQKGLNKLGRYAGRKVADAGDGKKIPWSDGFVACTILFCLPPMAVFGAVLDGVSHRWQTLAVKAVMDGVATMAFVRTMGWSAISAAVPVAAFLGSITLGARMLVPEILDSSRVDALHATIGLLVFCVALIILEFRKVELADYLPSLAWAPFLAWVWK